MITTRARIQGGRIFPHHEQPFRAALSAYEGKEVDVVIKRHRETMSQPQLRYWWAVPVAILAEHCGYDRDEMHAAIKWKFLRTIDAHGLEVVPSIRSLDTAAMTKLIDDVIRWALVELGVEIPLPNEVPVAEFELN